MLVNHLLEIKKEFKSFKKQGMEVLKIYREEQLLIKHYPIKHLILVKLRNMMDVNVDLNNVVFFYKISASSGVKSEIMSN